MKIERIQTGVRMEKSLVKVLKGTAEYLEMSLGDLLEGVVLHAFDGKPSPFNEETLSKINALKKVYDCEFSAEHAHKMKE